MKSITIDPEIASEPELLRLIAAANVILDSELGASSSQVTAAWRPTLAAQSSELGRYIELALTDSTGTMALIGFPPAELRDPRQISSRVNRLWGDLLQARSHKQIAELSQAVSRPDGGEVIDMISDAIFEYTEKHGVQPHILKLPLRYAVALMKLGFPFWGEFFKQIREYGIRTIDNQMLLGVPVRLLDGVDAKLEVE